MDITEEQAETITKNIERTGEFLQYLIDNPSEIDKIPNGSTIRFMDSNQAIEKTKGSDVLQVKKVYEYA